MLRKKNKIQIKKLFVKIILENFQFWIKNFFNKERNPINKLPFIKKMGK